MHFFSLYLFMGSSEAVCFVINSVTPSFMMSGNHIYRETFPLQDLKAFSTPKFN